MQQPLNRSRPEKQGLYNPANEHDSCGVGFVVKIDGIKSHEIITSGLKILRNLTHRGAVGADPKAGDGAGILLQLPDDFFRSRIRQTLPAAGHYAVGMLFMPNSPTGQAEAKGVVERYVLEEGQTVVAWRKVPVNNADLGESVLPSEPAIWQVVVGRGADLATQDDFERKLFVIRKQIECHIRLSDMQGKLIFISRRYHRG